MLASMTGQQLAEWMEYAKVEPFGEERADLRMGILASVTANAMTRTKESDPVAKPEDFMPKFEPQPHPQPLPKFDEHEFGEGSEEDLTPDPFPEMEGESEEEGEQDLVARKIEAYFSGLATQTPPPSPLPK